MSINGEADLQEVEMMALLEERFSSGQGVITLTPGMTDEQILALIKQACYLSKGKGFQVIPPRTD